MIINKAFYAELISILTQSPLPSRKVSRIKMDMCKKFHVKDIPTNIQILLNADEKDLPQLRYLQAKPTRTISGVSVVALMTKPWPCPHSKSKKGKKAVGSCIFCPGGPKSNLGDVPQSYTGKEPSTMRGIRNNFDSYLETMNRLEQYVALGHNFDKIELIVMGGTFNAFPKKYQEEFVMYAMKAMNDFGNLFFDSKGKFRLNYFKNFFLLPGDVGDEKRTKLIHKKLLKLKLKNKTSLEIEQKKNETSKIRCVGLTLETRPDCINIKTANEMLRLGATRIELGVQSVYNDVLKAIHRGHDVEESISATKLLKDLGFKINYHLMPGLPGVVYRRDLEGLKQIFSNPDFKPDMLKIYPCMVMKGTKLYDLWEAGKFTPLSTENAAKLIAEFKTHVPAYCRIQRVQRDIPSYMASAGVDRTNLRQIVEQEMNRQDIRCRCIRCREAGHVYAKHGKRPKLADVKLVANGYEASDGTEWFISFEDVKQDILLGFCRLRIPSSDSAGLRKEITKEAALVRELHVIGGAVEIGTAGCDSAKGINSNFQHQGLGKELLKEAEKIAKLYKKKKMVIISAIGTRDYYRKFGYKLEGVYMVKRI